MRIAVIDDERPSRQELCHLIRECLPEAQVLEADSGQAAVELAAREPIELFFVDIHLGDLTGTALVPLLRRLRPEAKIVFATAYDAYAVKAFELEAADYLLKPFDPARVRQCLEKLTAAKAPAEPEPERSLLPGKLAVACEKRVIVLDVDELAFIESDGHTCILHSAKGELTSAQPLGYYEKKLAAHRFFRIQKSYLVNLDYVTELTPWFNGVFSVKLRGYEQVNLPVSRRQLKPLRELFET